MQQRKALLGLKPQSYEHSLDRQALDAQVAAATTQEGTP